MLRQTKAALAETGLKMLDLELARILPGLGPEELPAGDGSRRRTGCPSRHFQRLEHGAHAERSFVVDGFGALCDLAKPLGLTVDLEFPIISRLTNLAEAADVVRAADRRNGGIMVDMLYMYFPQHPARTSWMPCRASGSTWRTFATRRRRYRRRARAWSISCATRGSTSGEGAIDIAAILERMPQVPYSIELPNDARVAEVGYEEHARRCLQAAKRYLEDHQPQVVAA